MTVCPDEIDAALSTVLDPCSIAMRAPIDIRAMGLVQEVHIDDGHVHVELVLTDPSCVHFRAMRRYITDVVLGVEGVEDVSVGLSTTLLWTSDRVHPE